MDEYTCGYLDALRWAYEYGGGDNFHLAIKDKMDKIINNK